MVTDGWSQFFEAPCSQNTAPNQTKTGWSSVKPSRFRRGAVLPMQQEQDYLPNFVPHRCRPISGSPTSLDRVVEHKCCFDQVRLGPLALQRFVLISP